MGVIYLRPNLINGKKYVGKTTDLKTRQYNWNNLTQPYAGPAINNARAKYGIDNFGFEILKECNDDELDYWEKYYIKELNTKVPYGYNMTEGGDGNNGYSPTEETRKKISEAQKGEKHWNYGKHLSEETRKKISIINKGKKLSEETRKKLSEAAKGRKPSELCRMRQIEAVKGKKRSPEAIRKSAEGRRGYKHTEETRKKISETAKGKHKGIYNTKISKPLFQINKNTNQIIREFPSLSQITRDLGYSIGNISQCCNGERKSAYGYIWKYKESAA